ncbi:16S rRNA (uracil(1498)-N(3))-methyltransferase [Pigmentiphaga litoralis]|uniref:Ribosomal RNA small subunit methyltransferase E n=1 Tax=Pigmentiphaga litoralis TaxID=516702 RepID=A0A7Y9LMJ1_9BURK|nr:16S rRNA (uracil(1498)-N(3))-methyltransferase [Pigmentiphaga litoralis]NYE25899.1 16S rRNA (uracil1498-N3)-methyltransferase [Pigmentiphaga litoralis]NYE85019.1 16S rRNA (uracil1498-N3)-methyltransferase [Pigmentiphaga litoralis]
MSLPRFFVDLPLAPNTRVPLPADIAHHAFRVLRLRDGEDVILFNGQGGQVPARLEAEGKGGWAALGDHDPREAELPGRITLVQGIASGDKMDWVIEKAVEVGAHAIQPIAATRSVLRLSGDRLDKRLVHWRRITVAACEQSGRNRVPQVFAPLTAEQYFLSGSGDLSSAPLRLICDPDAKDRLTILATQRPGDLANGVELLIGPEGGWSPEEMALAARHGVQPVRFGDRVLRTETAGIALVSALSATLGWI